MKCPYCENDDTKVLESRCMGYKTRRRRECPNCNKRFTTYEEIEHLPIMVIKRDNSREKFCRDKVFSGILKACEKRPVKTDDIEKIVQHIESFVEASLNREIMSSAIGDLCMSELKKMDKVAYIRFASVYREFKDVQSFMEELKSFLDENE